MLAINMEPVVSGEVLPSLLLSPNRTAAEGTIQTAVEWLRLGVESIGALVIAVGVLVSAWMLIRRHGAGFNAVRLTLASYLALALEFQLGADILSTAVAPTWDKIGKLGVIAVIRTGLNFFLMREMQQEQAKPKEAPIQPRSD